MNNDLSSRYVARVVLGATTPLAIRSGEKAIHTDALVVRDFNGLPYIPGTALAGVLRHTLMTAMTETEHIDLFGGQEQLTKENKQNFGSRVLVSDALLAGKDHKVMQVMTPSSKWPSYFRHFLQLPIREHVRLNEQGVAIDRGKFDEEVVYTGARFKCELELLGKAGDENTWQQLMSVITSGLQAGGGLTRGYGQLQVITMEQRHYDLSQPGDAGDYLSLSADMNSKFKGATLGEPRQDVQAKYPQPWINRNVDLGKGFFHFGAGYGDDQADAICYAEHVVHWEDNTPTLSEGKRYVIPGSSIKGLLSHRVAWLYNVQHGVTIEGQLEEMEKHFKACADEWMQVKLREIKEDIKETNPYDTEKEQLQKQLAQLEALKKKVEDEAKQILARTNMGLPFNENPAVVHLFGRAAMQQEDELESNAGETGKVIIDDIYLEPGQLGADVIFDHNAIDRFTGGTIEGALFTEKVMNVQQAIRLHWKVSPSVDQEMNALLEEAIKELQEGTLAMGGRTTKGHGRLHPVLQHEEPST